MTLTLPSAARPIRFKIGDIKAAGFSAQRFKP
jgi:hypothetical protein